MDTEETRKDVIEETENKEETTEKNNINVEENNSDGNDKIEENLDETTAQNNTVVSESETHDINNDNSDGDSNDKESNIDKNKKEHNYNKNYINRKKTYQNKRHNNQNNNRKRNRKNLIGQALKVPIMQVAEKLGIAITQNKTAECINPSHFDNQSSMSFNENKNRYECFVCGTSGSTIDMVRSILRVTPNKAAEWILDKIENTDEYKKFIPEDRKKKMITGNHKNESESGVITKPSGNRANQKSTHHGNKRNPDFEKQKEERNRLIKNGTMQNMYRFVKNNLTPISKIRIGLGFINDMRIRTETMDDLGIGIILNTENVENELKKRFKIEDLLTAGLFIKEENDSNDDYKFTFKEHNIIFPYISGRSIIFIQGRRLDNKEPLYMMTSPQQPIIYNYNVLRNMSEKQTLVICTDILNTVALIDKGFNTIGVTNALRFRHEWIKNIPTKNIILVSDDNKLKQKIGSIFLKNKINIRIADYDVVHNASKKDLKNNLGDYFKIDKSNKNDKPFWLESE